MLARQAAASAPMGTCVQFGSSSFNGPNVAPRSCRAATGARQDPSGRSSPVGQTSRWFDPLLSQCPSSTAIRRSASISVRSAPPASGSILSSSNHAHPSSSLPTIRLPSNGRSIITSLKVLTCVADEPRRHNQRGAPSFRQSRASAGSGGQPLQRTLCTSIIRSTAKPSAAMSRDAATSAGTSGLLAPYFTLIVLPSGSLQWNFGVVPLICLTTKSQSTSLPGSSVPGPGVFLLKSTFSGGTSGADQTRAVARATSLSGPARALWSAAGRAPCSRHPAADRNRNNAADRRVVGLVIPTLRPQQGRGHLPLLGPLRPRASADKSAFDACYRFGPC